MKSSNSNINQNDFAIPSTSIEMFPLAVKIFLTESDYSVQTYFVPSYIKSYICMFLTEALQKQGSV